MSPIACTCPVRRMSAAPTFPFSRHTWRIPADSVRFAADAAVMSGPVDKLYLEPEKKQWKHRYTFDADGSKLCGFFDERALPEVTVYVGGEPYVYRAKRSAWRSYAPIGYRIFDMIRVNEQ